MFNPSTGLRAAVCRNAGKGFQRIHSGLFFLKGLCDVRDNYTCRTLLCYSLENLDIIKVKLDKQSAQFKKKTICAPKPGFCCSKPKTKGIVI